MSLKPKTYKSTRSTDKMKSLPLLGLALSLICQCFVVGCREERKSIAPPVSDVENYPTMFTKNVSTLISDSGYTRYHIEAPVWYMYENMRDPRWTFPDGIHLERYDDDMNTNATIVCDSAIYFSQRKLWRLDSDVRIRNIEGDRFLTQQLFWDQQSRKIYSDSFIHIERSDRILEGFGFVSNDEMTDYVILRPSGIFPVPENMTNRDNASELPMDENYVEEEQGDKPRPKQEPKQPKEAPQQQAPSTASPQTTSVAPSADPTGVRTPISK